MVYSQSIDVLDIPIQFWFSPPEKNKAENTQLFRKLIDTNREIPKTKPTQQVR
jgi:hypothetical protein